jgi:hypothetical protein
MRHDPARLQSAIGRQQLAEIAIGIGDMVGAGARGVARRPARNFDQRQALMFVVVTQKAQPLVSKDDTGREHRLIPLGHFVELPGAQHEMGEFSRANRGLRQLPDLDCYVVHLVLLVY